jgi:hypothetical protein
VSCAGSSKYLFPVCFIFSYKFSFIRLTYSLCQEWLKLLPPNFNSGTPLQFLLGYVEGVTSFTLSLEINLIIIQIVIVLKKYTHIIFVY